MVLLVFSTVSCGSVSAFNQVVHLGVTPKSVLNNTNQFLSSEETTPPGGSQHSELTVTFINGDYDTYYISYDNFFHTEMQSAYDNGLIYNLSYATAKVRVWERGTNGDSEFLLIAERGSDQDDDSILWRKVRRTPTEAMFRKIYFRRKYRQFLFFIDYYYEWTWSNDVSEMLQSSIDYVLHSGILMLPDEPSTLYENISRFLDEIEDLTDEDIDTLEKTIRSIFGEDKSMSIIERIKTLSKMKL
ncbi:MAG: hypothetical protein NUW37_06440 [Planctomycetes bacterium]|nr:hypothetical protein [Planctomycetota bacterium]